MINLLRCSLRVFHWNLYRLQGIALRSPLLVLFGVAVLFGAFAYKAPQVRVGINTADWLDPRVPSTQSYLQLKSLFQSEDKLVWISPLGLDHPDLCRFQKDILFWNLQNPDIQKVNSVFELRHALIQNEDKLFYPTVLNENCQWQQAALLSIPQHPLSPGLLLGPDQQLILSFTFFELEKAGKFGNVDFNFISSWIEQLRKNYPGGFFGGNLFFQLSVKEGMQRAQLLNLVTALLILLLTRLFVGRWLAGFLLVSLVLFTTLALQTGMALMGHLIDPLSSSLFVLMTIATLEDFYFLYYVGQSRKLNFLQSSRRLLLPSFFTSFTTAVGFGSLALSDNQSLQRLGVWAAIGAMIEWALLFLALPSLAKKFKFLQDLGSLSSLVQKPWLARLAHYKPSKKWSLCSLIPLLFVPWLYPFGNINYSPFDMFKESHPLNQYRQQIEKHFGYQGDVSILFDKERLTLQDSALLQQMAQLPSVKEVRDPELIFSQLVPEAVSPSWRRLMHHDFSQTSAFKEMHSEQKTRALVQIKSIDLVTVEQVTEQLVKICGDQCTVTGELVAFKDYAYSMLKTLFESFFSSMIPIVLTIFLLCLAVLKKPHWPLLISSFWAPSFLLLFVVLFQVKINVVTCLAMALLIGLAGDNAINFLLFKDRKSSVSSRQKDLSPASVLILIIMAAISSVLLFSYFRSAQILSGLMLLGVLLLLIGDVWIFAGLDQSKKTSVVDKANP